MTFGIEQIAKIASPIITLIIGAIIKHYTEKQSKLISYIGHVSSFVLKDEKQTRVYSHSVIVRNAGSKAARNIRLGHIYLPLNINVYPPIQYSIEKNPDEASEIVFPILVPKEQVTISYLYFPPITWDKVNSYTKSDDGYAKIINVIPTPQLPHFLAFLVRFLMFAGASFILYLLILLIIYTL